MSSENFFVWDAKKYALNLPTIDKEHMQIIELMNVLYVKYQGKAAKDDIQRAIKNLADYTAKHFADEEKFFSTIPNYPLVNAHKKIHKDLLERLSGYGVEFSKTGTLTPDFFNFLKVWLFAHIASIDLKYSQAYHNKAA